VLDIADAFWRHSVSVPVGCTVDGALLSTGVDELPIVRREASLRKAGDSMLHNHWQFQNPPGEHNLKLCFCAQPSGIGKTSFGKHLWMGLNEGFGGRMAYCHW
jgi:hypothetical protein